MTVDHVEYTVQGVPRPPRGLAHRAVEFFYDFSSNNTYFAYFMLGQLAERIPGVSVRLVPVHVGAVFRDTRFSVEQFSEPKMRYLMKDHARWAERTGTPFRHPTGELFPVKTSAALRCAIASRRWGAASEAKVVEAVLRAYWERGEDISKVDVLQRCIANVPGVDAEELWKLQTGDATRRELEASTQSAVERGLFGCPSFIVGGELFWGKDRLEFVEDVLRFGRVTTKGLDWRAVPEARL